MIEQILTSLNQYQGFITLIAGFVVYFVYRKQKSDYKKDAARLIIQEVRYAEQQIKNARDVGYTYSLANKLLPTNSWHKNIHLFIKDLKETEIDIISKFYSNAVYLDRVIDYISDFKHKALIPINGETVKSFKTPEKLKISEKNLEGLNGVGQKNIAFEPLSKKILEDVSRNVEFIYNTPAIDKLRKISEKKWYLLYNEK